MPPRRPKRLDTKLEAEGAEFLVLGHLLLVGIPCFKAYTNLAGYDLVATNPVTGRSARIQVKSRWATNYDHSFPIKNFNCDFVVHVALNRGYRFGKTPKAGDSGVRPPVFYIFPMARVRRAQNPKSRWGKVHIRKIPGCETYRDNWGLISEYLAKAP